MRVIPEVAQSDPESSASAPEDREFKTLILEELRNIVESPFFQKSHRGSQFLRYVVERKLQGDPKQLKERTIGADLYHRRPDYATGDDPVVRVQAGEVRRKLGQYYRAARGDGMEPSVRIELPIGSYSPIFHFASSENRAASSDPVVLDTISDQTPIAARAMQRFKPALILAAVGIVLLGALLIARVEQPGKPQSSLTRRFWEPIFGTPQPVLICLAKGVTYRPDEKLYDLYSQKHPGTFQTEVERSNDPLPLDPRQPILWGDLSLYDDYGVAGGDVSTALRVSEYLGSIGKPLQVRIGNNYSFEDLRHSPAVVIGAFNNKWTMELTSGLRFAFVELPDRGLEIHETTPDGREWRGSSASAHGAAVSDYAVVTRLLDSKTGQFIITAAGITGSGTEAAGELATRPEYLEQVLRSAPANWEKGNVQIVLQTSVTDRVPGPPRAVATYYWGNP